MKVRTGIGEVRIEGKVSSFQFSVFSGAAGFRVQTRGRSVPFSARSICCLLAHVVLLPQSLTPQAFSGNGYYIMYTGVVNKTREMPRSLRRKSLRSKGFRFGTIVPFPHAGQNAAAAACGATPCAASVWESSPWSAESTRAFAARKNIFAAREPAGCRSPGKAAILTTRHPTPGILLPPAFCRHAAGDSIDQRFGNSWAP